MTIFCKHFGKIRIFGYSVLLYEFSVANAMAYVNRLMLSLLYLFDWRERHMFDNTEFRPYNAV